MIRLQPRSTRTYTRVPYTRLFRAEFSRLGKLLDGAHIAMVGDLKYGRTVHSLIKLLALYKGIKFTLISPPELEMPTYIIEQASRNGDRKSTRLNSSH